MRRNSRSKISRDGKSGSRTSDFNLIVGGCIPEVRESEDRIVVLFLCFTKRVRVGSKVAFEA